MKTKKYVIIGYILILLLLMVTGCGHQDLSTTPGEENVETEENGDEVTVKDILIHSKEEAQIIMQNYLQEKYGKKYIVEIPVRNDEGDYIADAYEEQDAENLIQVVAEVSTKKCRDNGCLRDVNLFIENLLNQEASQLWEQFEIQVDCIFENDVPRFEWTSEDDIEFILKEEPITCCIYFMIQNTTIDKENETVAIQKMLQQDMLENVYCVVRGYYVSPNIYQETCDQLQAGDMMKNAACAQTNEQFFRTVIVVQTEEDNLEDIRNGFRK